MKTRFPVVLVLVAALPLGAVRANDSSGHAHGHDVASAGAAATAEPTTEGEIRKVDPSAQKITVKHGPIENLGMPGMTMVFRVQDPHFLTIVKPGDHVKMRVERIDGALTIVALQPIS
ncbi:MAG: copper-binding protein [Reyranella sp.]